MAVSRSKSALSGALVAQVFTILSMLLAIFSTPYMLKYLDTEEYGISILLFQILSYLSLFDFGLSTAVIRSMSLVQPDDSDASVQSQLNSLISTSFFFSTFLGLVVLLAVFFASPFMPSVFNMRLDLQQPAIAVFLSLGVVILTTFMQRGIGGMFFAHHRQALITTPSVVVSILSVAATVWLLSLGYGLWSFVYVNLATSALNLLISVTLSRIYYPALSVGWRHFDVERLKSLYAFGLFMFLSGLATQVILATDRIVIGKVVSLAAVGMFSITVRIPEVCQTLLSHVTFHASPALAEIVNRGDEEQVKKTYYRLAILTITLSVVAFWVIIIMSEWFITLWVGKSYFAGQSVLILALVIMLQQTLTRTGTFFLNAKGIARPISLMSVVEAVLNLSISIGLGYLLGLSGILLGTVIATGLTSGWFIPQLLRKHLGVSANQYWLKSFLKPLVYLSVIGLGLYSVVSHYYMAGSLQGWLSFILTGVVVGVLLMGAAWVLFLHEILIEFVPSRLKAVLKLQ